MGNFKNLLLAEKLISSFTSEIEKIFFSARAKLEKVLGSVVGKINPDLLTLSQIPLTFAGISAYFLDQKELAAGLLAAKLICDCLDGIAAREREVDDDGQLLDPFIDKSTFYLFALAIFGKEFVDLMSPNFWQNPEFLVAASATTMLSVNLIFDVISTKMRGFKASIEAVRSSVARLLGREQPAQNSQKESSSKKDSAVFFGKSKCFLQHVALFQAILAEPNLTTAELLAIAALAASRSVAQRKEI